MFDHGPHEFLLWHEDALGWRIWVIHNMCRVEESLDAEGLEELENDGLAILLFYSRVCPSNHLERCHPVLSVKA